jgi:hypothetical protein
VPRVRSEGSGCRFGQVGAAERPAALVFAGLAYGLITLGGVPLLAALFGLVPLSIAVAGIENARAR